MGKQFGWGRFLAVAVPVSILTFILDVAFHKTAGPALFGDSYPAADYPQRPLAEIMQDSPMVAEGIRTAAGVAELARSSGERACTAPALAG